MKTKQNVFGRIVACGITLSFWMSFSVEAAADSSITLKDNYALWHQSGFYDDGMLQQYVQELSYTAGARSDYFLSTALSLSEQDSWYDSGRLPEDGEPWEIYANISNNESALFYVKSSEDIEYASEILSKYYPRNASRYYKNDHTCFYLTDNDQSVINEIQQELTISGIIDCFYYNVPIYQHRKLSVPYLTGYLDSQMHNATSPQQLSEAYLQAYIDEKNLPCKIKTNENNHSTIFYIVPNINLSFQEHWALALQLYHNLDIVPYMLPDLISQQAFNPPKGAGISYDVNADSIFNTKDVAMLLHYLLASGELIDPLAGDLNEDNCINAIDLTLMKRALLKKQQSSNIIDLIDPPIRALESSLPSVGNVRVPVFAVNFPDCSFTAKEIVEKLQNSCFSASNPADPAYPHESIAAYFERASYGRLKLTGDVFQYTAEHPIDWYAEDDARQLVDEIMATFDAQIDYTEYDIDHNQVLDALVIALPENALQIDNDEDGKPDWWPFSTSTTSGTLYDGIKTGKYCSIVFDSKNYGDFNQKTAHELCHAMGLPDYYRYYSDSSENDGLIGEAGYELMDEGTGDLSSCSKLLLGWLTDDEIQVYSGNTQSFIIESFPDAPSCIMIPRNQEDGYLSEYFLIEYVTPESNQPMYSGSGIRILHVDAEVSEGKHGMELTYNNYGLHYDKSEKKQRVLRLVNDEWLYPGKKGSNYMDIIDSTVEGFHWYDENGDLVIDTGLTIRIERLHTESYYQDSTDTGKWINGIARITISKVETEET